MNKSAVIALLLGVTSAEKAIDLVERAKNYELKWGSLHGSKSVLPYADAESYKIKLQCYDGTALRTGAGANGAMYEVDYYFKGMELSDIVYPDQILHESLDENQPGNYFEPLYTSNYVAGTNAPLANNTGNLGVDPDAVS